MSKQTAAGHVRAVTPLFALSVIGIIATAGFQLLVIRQLGPASFGLLVAYLALINVASIGSSAVRNSVAVGTARAGDLPSARAKDRTFLESLVYGALFGAVVVFMLLTGAYTSAPAGILVAASVIPYFVFARAQGLMQGSGQITRVLVWSTGAQVLQLILAVAALLAGADWMGVLFATMVVAVLGAVLSTVDSRRLSLVSLARPFSAASIRALLVTVSFTWLISMDVTWVQQFGSATSAGEYGSVATIVKVAFLVPTTLALYLLPKFARNLNDDAFQTRALLWSAGAASISGLCFALFLWLWPGFLTLLFGSAYANVGAIAVWIAIAFLPWVIGQAVVTQMIASGAVSAIVVLVLAAVAQYLLAQAVLPDIHAWILAHGLLGLAVLAAMVAIFISGKRKKR